MLEQTRESCFVLRERDDAVADIARRKHVELFAQASAGATIVTDCDYSAELGNIRCGGGRGNGFGWKSSVALQSSQYCREAGAAATGYYAQGATALFSRNQRSHA